MSAHLMNEIRCNGDGTQPCPEDEARTSYGAAPEIRGRLQRDEGWTHPLIGVDRCEACTQRAGGAR